LERTRETILPFLQEIYTAKELTTSYQKYQEIQKAFQKLSSELKIVEYIQNTQNQHHFEIGKKLFVDFRITDSICPNFQDKIMPLKEPKYTRKDHLHNDKQGETYQQRRERNKEYLHFINQKYATHTIITVSH
jgi:hypothetical protein